MTLKFFLTLSFISILPLPFISFFNDFIRKYHANFYLIDYKEIKMHKIDYQGSIIDKYSYLLTKIAIFSLKKNLPKWNAKGRKKPRIGPR